MAVYEIKLKKLIQPLFYDWQETFIWSCLQGYMGKAYADDLHNPKSAQIIVGDFCFFAGEPNYQLIENKPEDYNSEFVIMVPKKEDWNKAIEEVYGSSATKRIRYATKKEYDVFNKDNLQRMVSTLSQEYQLKIIDRELYTQVLLLNWGRDLCSNFKSYEDYEKHGLGVVILKGQEIVSGASSYSVYEKGIEIEIDTREDHRRKGLALVCGAKLILECLKRGLYPSWDAHNKGSLSLAKKLGYSFYKEYPVYEINGY